MSSMSRPEATSDAKVVDLEKGLKAAAIEEEAELVVVNPRLATCIKATLDVFVVAYTLSLIGCTLLLVKVSDNWWDPWPSYLFYALLLHWTCWMTPLVKDGLVKKYAMATHSELTTKLLASKK